MKVQWLKKTVSCVTLAAFIVMNAGPSFSQMTQASVLPAPGQMVALSDASAPAVLKGIKVYPENPFRFDFILDPGDTPLQGDGKDESAKLVRYFLASLTMPEKDLWVNLSPYEKDRIIANEFGRTEMGRELLSQDYLLKQITASLIYPEGDVGKKFWTRVYQMAYDQYGTTDIPVDTFNKVWITPDKAVVYENGDKAFIVKSHMKVMLESDYVAMSHQKVMAESPASAGGLAASNNAVSTVAADQQPSELAKTVLREVAIPELEREVNEGKHFAPLRQVYQSLILAAWFKKKIKQSVLSQVYVDQKKIAGVSIDDKDMAQKVWTQYVEAFKKGAYNYIKEEQDAYTGELIPRKYFSGGIGYEGFSGKTLEVTDDAMQVVEGNTFHMINIRLESSHEEKKSGSLSFDDFLKRINGLQIDYFDVKNALLALEQLNDLKDKESFKRRQRWFLNALGVFSDTPQEFINDEGLNEEGASLVKNLLSRKDDFIKLAASRDIVRGVEKNRVIGDYLFTFEKDLDDPQLRQTATGILSQLAHVFGLTRQEVDGILDGVIFIRTSGTKEPLSMKKPLIRSFVIDGQGLAQELEAVNKKDDREDEERAKQMYLENRTADEVVALAKEVLNEYLETQYAEMMTLGDKAVVLVHAQKVSQEYQGFALTAELGHVIHAHILKKIGFGVETQDVLDFVVAEMFDTLSRLVLSGEDLSINNLTLGRILYRWADGKSEEDLRDLLLQQGMKEKDFKNYGFADYLSADKDLISRMAYLVFSHDTERYDKVVGDHGFIGHHMSAFVVHQMVQMSGSVQRASVVLRLMIIQGQRDRDWAKRWNRDYRVFIKEFERMIKERGQEVDDIVSRLYGLVMFEPVKTNPYGETVVENYAEPGSFDAKGGIDFNSDLLDLQLQNSGQAVKFNVDPAMLKRLEAMPGFSPVIIDIKPLSSVKSFLGISNN